VVVLILSAFITPSDPFSMFVLAIPLDGLYEFSILICKKETPEPQEEEEEETA
jgi:sec-independent protein translocase protein TatC